MSVILIDFETTGLDPMKDRITEIGAMKVSDDFAEDIDSLSTLVWAPDYPKLTPEVSKLTHITQEMLGEAATPEAAFKALRGMVDADVREVIAFNSPFDEGMFKAQMDRQDLTLHPAVTYMVSRPWLCAMEDLESNYQFKSWKLAHLALEYGLIVDPSKLHRAIGDVELMRRVLRISGAHIDTMRAFKDMPWVYLKAHVKKPFGPQGDGGIEVAKAKALGYSFERAKGDTTGKEFEKSWVKRVKEKFVEQDLLNAPFKVTKLAV